MKHSLLGPICRATLTESIHAVPPGQRYGRAWKELMESGGTRESILLAALGRDGWRCEGTRSLGVALDGIAGGDGGTGLRLYWIERAMCSLSWSDGQELLVPAGSIVVLPRTLPHRLRPCAGVTLAWVMTAIWPASAWCSSLLLHDRAVLHEAIACVDPSEALLAVRARIAEPGATPGAAEGAMLERCAREVASRAISLAESSPGHSVLGAALSHARIGPWLRELLALSGPLPDIEACAARCNLSRAAFTRRIAELTGSSYLDFATRWRMNMALHRLVLAGDNVADLAARCGYESEASFRKAFRRATGVTPGAVRQARSLDAAMGAQAASASADEAEATGAGGAGRTTLHAPRPAPAKVSVSTHTTPPDLASLLTGLISNL